VAFDRSTLQSNTVSTLQWPPSQHQFLMQRFSAAPDSALYQLPGHDPFSTSKTQNERRSTVSKVSAP
uniref:Uncharacterized protein n=1 Tax=Aegilops tauschii subsp. strangulata TaxID=200361 RepID=A0A453JL26_AEGTS